jgi:hypothetical protein
MTRQEYKKIDFRNEELYIVKEEYNSGGIALTLYDGEGDPYLVATSYVPGLEKNEVAIKNYSENEGILETLIKENVISKPKRYVSQGFVEFPICDVLV